MIKQSQNLLSVLKVKDINDCVTKMYPAFNPQIANMFMWDKFGTLFSSYMIKLFKED